MYSGLYSCNMYLQLADHVFGAVTDRNPTLHNELCTL